MLKQKELKSSIVEEITKVLEFFPKESLDNPILAGVWARPIVIVKQLTKEDLNYRCGSENSYIKPFSLSSVGDIMILTDKNCIDFCIEDDRRNAEEFLTGSDVLSFFGQIEDKNCYVTICGDPCINIFQLPPKRENVKYWKDCKEGEKPDSDWWEQLLYTQGKVNRLNINQLIIEHDVNCV